MVSVKINIQSYVQTNMTGRIPRSVQTNMISSTSVPTFASGDSYIVLHTTEDEENENALQWDIYFWIGSDSSQDEVMNNTDFLIT